MSAGFQKNPFAPEKFFEAECFSQPLFFTLRFIQIDYGNAILMCADGILG